jgi:hypothetical protein
MTQSATSCYHAVCFFVCVTHPPVRPSISSPSLTSLTSLAPHDWLALTQVSRSCLCGGSDGSPPPSSAETAEGTDAKLGVGPSTHVSRVDVNHEKIIVFVSFLICIPAPISSSHTPSSF